MTILFTNNAAATLASSITTSSTSLTVTSGQGALFPTITGSNIFYVTLTDAATGNFIEIVKVTARSSDTMTIVRAQDNTSAHAYAAGDKVELRLPAIVLQDFPQLDVANTFTGTNTFTGNTVIQLGLGVGSSPSYGTSGQVLTSAGSGAAPTWTTISTGGGPISFNSTTISTNQTVSSGNNGFSVGPMTINSGVTVTVASGQRWVTI